MYGDNLVSLSIAFVFRMAMNTGKLTMYRNASRHLMGRSEELRKKMTPAEIEFWEWVRGGRMLGLKFRRQHALAYYVADFYCHKLSLVIEIDGKIHQRQEIASRDKFRQEVIEQMGIKVLRFTNEEVLTQKDACITKLQACLSELLSSSDPPSNA